MSLKCYKLGRRGHIGIKLKQMCQDHRELSTRFGSKKFSDCRERTWTDKPTDELEGPIMRFSLKRTKMKKKKNV